MDFIAAIYIEFKGLHKSWRFICFCCNFGLGNLIRELQDNVWIKFEEALDINMDCRNSNFDSTSDCRGLHYFIRIDRASSWTHQANRFYYILLGLDRIKNQKKQEIVKKMGKKKRKYEKFWRWNVFLIYDHCLIYEFINTFNSIALDNWYKLGELPKTQSVTHQ